MRSLHTFADFGAGYQFKLSNGSMWKTCKAALGFSFAAGTTDWPGFADFTQNDPGAPSNPFWLLVRGLIKTPSQEQVECHKPKPILLDVGGMDQPYAWYEDFFLLGVFVIPAAFHHDLTCYTRATRSTSETPSMQRIVS